MSFEITFLGLSGGPLEYGNCALMVKPASLSYSQILQARDKPLFTIDAGAGWHVLAKMILTANRESRGQGGSVERTSCQLGLYEDSLRPEEYLEVPLSQPFAGLEGLPLRLLKDIFSKVSASLITHPHLDHIQSLVLNLAGATEAGDKTTIHASEFTIDALNKHVFNGVIWPDLVSLGFLDLVTVPETRVFEIADGAYVVTYFELSHGTVANKGQCLEPYQSLAFLVNDTNSQEKLLVFGDFEADTTLRLGKNSLVWELVAPFVLDGTLKAIILECSTHSKEPGANLYGHMTPQHVISEFQRLEEFCKEQAQKSLSLPFLKDLNVIVTHVKDTYDGKDPRRQILSELRLLNEDQGLRLKVSVASNGILIVI